MTPVAASLMRRMSFAYAFQALVSAVCVNTSTGGPVTPVAPIVGVPTGPRAVVGALRERVCERENDCNVTQHTSAHVSTRQHTSAYVSIRQHTSGALWERVCERGDALVDDSSDTSTTSKTLYIAFLGR